MVPGVSVKVAIVLVPSRLTVPVASAQGAAQVNVKVAPPVMPATGSLKVAVIIVVLVATPIALLAGVSVVTVGTRPATPCPPKMGSWPPQPATKVLSSIAAMNIRYLELLRNLFMRPSLQIRSGKPAA